MPFMFSQFSSILQVPLTHHVNRSLEWGGRADTHRMVTTSELIKKEQSPTKRRGDADAEQLDGHGGVMVVEGSEPIRP